MKAIIFNTEADAESLVREINSVFKGLFRGVTKSYTYYIKHPTLNKWAVIMSMKHVNDMVTNYPELIEQISLGVESIEELDDSWIVSIDE